MFWCLSSYCLKLQYGSTVKKINACSSAQLHHRSICKILWCSTQCSKLTATSVVKRQGMDLNNCSVYSFSTLTVLQLKLFELLLHFTEKQPLGWGEQKFPICTQLFQLQCIHWAIKGCTKWGSNSKECHSVLYNASNTLHQQCISMHCETEAFMPLLYEHITNYRPVFGLGMNSCQFPLPAIT